MTTEMKNDFSLVLADIISVLSYLINLLDSSKGDVEAQEVKEEILNTQKRLIRINLTRLKDL